MSCLVLSCMYVCIHIFRVKWYYVYSCWDAKEKWVEVGCTRYLPCFWQAWWVANCQVSLSIDRALLFVQHLFVYHRICDVCRLLPAGAQVEWGRFHNFRFRVEWWFGWFEIRVSDPFRKWDPDIPNRPPKPSCDACVSIIGWLVNNANINIPLILLCVTLRQL